MSLYEATLTNPDGYTWTIRRDNRIELAEYLKDHADCTVTWKKIR